MGFGVWGLGFEVWGLEFGVWGFGFRIEGFVLFFGCVGGVESRGLHALNLIILCI